ncbi:hypothetical protein QTH09_00975 [Clostridium perfringens]|nr:hypothetical protein [Clostridium perfringens]
MKFKSVPFNINGWVKVRLTEDAKRYLEEKQARYGGKLILDEEGYFHSQLWCLIHELGPIMRIAWNPILGCEMIFDEINIEISDEIENIRNAYDSEFKRYLNIIRKYKVNIEYFELLAKVCTYYGYTLDDLKEKLIKKEDMRRFIDE